MKLVVQYKHMNCIVDKTKSTGTGYNYITNYVTGVLLIILCDTIDHLLLQIFENRRIWRDMYLCHLSKGFLPNTQPHK